MAKINFETRPVPRFDSTDLGRAFQKAVGEVLKAAPLPSRDRGFAFWHLEMAYGYALSQRERKRVDGESEGGPRYAKS